ncbi:hypothetical protein QR680_012866 [Steinernema hermaphroditum]|uniref:Uncharacterized protein n=1 Tax=Steinernema hermaphroditum TaxID=289476 RepID=A0AA39M1C2_9BILA|nr:hypothetical protein QR680_012866 [Steinernema hermaphroditum]
MRKESVGNGVGAMPALPSPLAQLQAEYARRLAEESPNFRPFAAPRERLSGVDAALHAKKSEYLFEGTIGKAADDDVATGLEASTVESIGQVPSLTDSSVFGFSDAKTSASQISIYLPSQRPSDFSIEEPMNIFAWNRHKASEGSAANALGISESLYCCADMNDTVGCYARPVGTDNAAKNP